MSATMKLFDETDWSGFAGAERFLDGGEPFIGERAYSYGQSPCIVIVDAGGVSVEIGTRLDRDDQEQTWFLALPARLAALAVAEAFIASHLSPADFGFERIR